MRVVLFNLVHGDWYGDQKSGDIDNYEEFRITYNTETKTFGRQVVTLRFEFCDGGFTFDQITNWLNDTMAKHNRTVTDYKYSKWYGSNECPEIAQLFAQYIH